VKKVKKVLSKESEKSVNVKVARVGMNFKHVKPPFCSFQGCCEFKRFRIAYYSRTKRRRYQLCRWPSSCNQKTEKPVYFEV
jgi:hypothetical protein